MTARDILYNIQQTSSVCVTTPATGKTYVDRFPVGGGEVHDRILGGLVFTESIPQAWGNSVLDVLGNTQLAGTPKAPLTDEYNVKWRGQPYDISVCGIQNKGMGNQIVTTFADRLPFYSGIMNGAPRSDNKFLFSFGSSHPVWDKEILDVLLKEGDVANKDNIDFSATTPSQADSSGDIDIEVSRASLSSASTPFVFDFSQTLTDLDIRVEEGGADGVHDSFSFENITSTKLTSSTTIDLSVEIEDNTSSTQTVTITSSVPLHKMEWEFRGFTQTARFKTWPSNFSVSPTDESLAKLGTEDNTLLIWQNMGGVTTVTFTITNFASPFQLVKDTGGRAHFFNGAKIWPQKIVERKSQPVIGVFSIAPDVSPSGGGVGTYKWSNASINNLTLENTFDTSDGDLVMSVDGNRVSFENDVTGITLIIKEAYVDPAGVESKLSYAPLLIGIGNNITPLELSDGSYYVPYPSITEVRHDGAVIPQAASLVEFLDNESNDVISWLGEAEANQTVAGESIRFSVSAVTGLVTMDAGIASTVSGIINELAAIADVTVSSIDATLSAYPAAWYYTDQVTFRQALDQILAPLNAFARIDNGELVVEKRIAYTETYTKEIQGDIHVIDGNIDIGLPLPSYHELIVNYDRNWTPQAQVNGYKNPFKKVNRAEDSVKYSDYPTNSILSGSIVKTVDTCLTDIASANDQLSILDTQKREQLPVQFYIDNRQGDLRNNIAVGITSPLFNGGMFLAESGMLDTDRRTTFIKGVWYGE